MPVDPTVFHVPATRRLASGFLALALLLLQLAPVLAAEITTDLWVYQYGDTVTVSGDGFGGNEGVELVTTDPYAVEVDRGTALTDDYGNFVYQFVLLSDVPGIYDVVATGLSSGLSAATQFDPVSVTVTNIGSLAWYRDTGSGIDLTVNGTYQCSSPQCTSPSSILVEIRRSDGASGATGAVVASRTVTGLSSGSGTFAWGSQTFAFRAAPAAGEFAMPVPGGLLDVKATFTFTGTGTSPQVASRDDQFGIDNVAPNVAISSVIGTPSAPVASGTASDTLSGLLGNSVSLEIRQGSSAGPAVASGTANVPQSGPNAGTWTHAFASPPTTSGTYCVVAIATDKANYGGNVSEAAYSPCYSIASANTPPVLTVPGSAVTAEATSPLGANVAFPVSATDAEDDPDPTPTCDHASGSLFAIGDTLVTCSVIDSGSLSDSDSFHVVVSDTTDPAVSIYPDLADTTSGSGWFNILLSGTNGVLIHVDVSDAVGVSSLDCTDDTGAGPVSIPGPLNPAGDSFVVWDGTHDVECVAQDGAGNSGSDSDTFMVDQTAPSISAAVTPAAAGTGWWNLSTTAPTVTYTCGDGGSGLASCTSPYTFGEGAAQDHTGTALDVAGNNKTASVSGINVDLTAPGISYDGQTPAANVWGWNRTSVQLDWTCTDGLSGVVSGTDSETLLNEGANQSATGTCYDIAGNHSSDLQSGIDIDLTNPDVPAYVGGPADGASYYFGSVPAAPTCTSADALSGLIGCVVSGYSALVGTHTMTATATDYALNSSSLNRTYTVLAWTLTGFYQPVDNFMLNTVKNGSTVPLKFEVFAGSTELTSTDVVDRFVVQEVGCESFEDMPLDPIEFVTTGGTSLRYDSIAGQFIQNWKTPKTAGRCYRVSMYTDDGSSLSALFKLK